MRLREEMKIGPKGQVVIPKIFRKQIGLQPGSKIVIELKDNALLLERPKKDIIKHFEMIAAKGKHAKLKDHEYYEELETRWKKVKR